MVPPARGPHLCVVQTGHFLLLMVPSLFLVVTVHCSKAFQTTFGLKLTTR